MDNINEINTVYDRGGAAQPLLTIKELTRYFTLQKGFIETIKMKKRVVHAVDHIDFKVLKGETLGVVGESGCGKSTTARLLMQLIKPSSGEIIFDGEEVDSHALSLRDYRKQVQMVFQDSYSSLNPRLTIEESIAFGPMVHGVKKTEAIDKARNLLAKVGLEPLRFAARYPHELSGGQRQRVNIARALASNPRLVILDEAVAALDKSVEAQVINLLMDLKESLGLTYIFISHDLHVVRYISDRVMVMYLGKIAEIGSTELLFNQPLHPYTKALLSSMPSLDPDHRTLNAPLAGDPPNPIDPPSGCYFHTRCALAESVCQKTIPTLETLPNGRQVACLIYVTNSGHSRACRINSCLNKEAI